MTKSTLKIIWFIALTIGTLSCTVQKRLYQKGFHVEWRHTLKSKKTTEPSNSELLAEIVKPVQADTSKISRATDQEIANTADMDSHDSQSNPLISRIIPIKPTNNPKIAQIQTPEKTVVRAKGERTDPDIRMPKKKIEPLGIVSLILIIFAFILALLFLTNFVEWIFWIAAGAIVLIAFTLGVYSVFITRKYPEAYHKNLTGYFGLFTSIAAIGIALIIGIFFLIYSI